ncbi:MAG TPA: glycosyltransferase [Lacunisphaera sp.]|jgi:glycosyltransferase involved in cell wall biosynthesis
MPASSTHLVLLPTYNTGPRLIEVVREVLCHWQPVLVVVDGSTDGSEQALLEMAKNEPALSIQIQPQNSGKGAAVLAGAREAVARGFTHALVMDADGQHPAASIAEFMDSSTRCPEALVLGRPVFPPNIPPERLHGRKLSVGLVHFEVLGKSIADPLFGFRVYPLAALIAVLGRRRTARRYDFDTEAAVRLAWAGVPPVNLAAPVRYFSRAEGGISHFHYWRDNATLVWMHTRLIAELLLWRWPTVRRHQRAWRSAALALAMLVLFVPSGRTAEADPLVNPTHQISPNAPAWHDLAIAFAHKPDVTALFTEQRFFPFKKTPVELKGEVRVSASRGLSLHYTDPEKRTVILDEKGVLIRAPAGEKAAPADPRAAAANEALLNLLRFDFTALEKDFELYGEQDAVKWTLVLVPRTDALRHSVGRITATGEGATIRHIEIRRTARQAIEIIIDRPQPPAPFTAGELKAFFR